MRLVVSIVLYQPDPGLLKGTLSSLAAAARKALNEGRLSSVLVRVADNSPSALSPGMLARLGAAFGGMGWIELEYAHMECNLGFGRAHNRNFFRSGARPDIFLVANPDLRFEEESIANGIAFLRENADVGLVIPSVSDGRSAWRPACFRYPDVVTLLARAIAPRFFDRRIRRYECHGEEPAVARGDPRLASGCCMLFRADMFAALSGFDERYFLYFEDFDLSCRASGRFASAHCPHMKIIHLGGGAARKGLRHIALFSRSGRIFFSTHGWRWL